MQSIKPIIIRQRRKTISLHINPDATLTVKAPYLIPKFFIDRFIKEKQDWITSKLHQMSVRPKAIQRTFVDGEPFLFLGKKYLLKIVHNSTIELKDFLYFPFKNVPSIKKRIIDWYKHHALATVSLRVKLFSKSMNVEYENISISNGKGRWGACTGTNDLSFNWRLIMAPMAVIDYVVIHELAHIKEHNHSKKFWAIVQKYCPDYRIKIRWLKRNGNALDI